MERNIVSALHRFEHRMLRSAYMDDPNRFNERMLTNEKELFLTYDEFCNHNGESNPYQPKDFSVSRMYGENGAEALMFTFPKPEAPTDCYRIYTFFVKSEKVPGFFTIEHVRGKGPDEPFICRWMMGQNGWTHIGGIEPEGDEFTTCARFYQSFDFEEFMKMVEAAKSTAKKMTPAEMKELFAAQGGCLT